MNKERERARKKAWGAANRERQHTYNKAWKDANPERLRAYNRAWRDANAEHIRALNKAWYAANKERKRVYSKARYAANKEQANAYARARHAANPERKRANDKAWSAANPERRLAKVERRRARIAQVLSTLTPQEWEAILVAAGYSCIYCGDKERLSMDHLVPISRGGPHTAENVAPACQPCNSSKGTKAVMEFLAER